MEETDDFCSSLKHLFSLVFPTSHQNSLLCCTVALRIVKNIFLEVGALFWDHLWCLNTNSSNLWPFRLLLFTWEPFSYFCGLSFTLIPHLQRECALDSHCFPKPLLHISNRLKCDRLHRRTYEPASRPLVLELEDISFPHIFRICLADYWTFLLFEVV